MQCVYYEKEKKARFFPNFHIYISEEVNVMGRHVNFILLSEFLYIHIYTYIYINECVCVCVFLCLWWTMNTYET